MRTRKPYCENCGKFSGYDLEDYDQIRDICDPITLCDVCSRKPLKKIKRHRFSLSGTLIEQDLPLKEDNA